MLSPGLYRASQLRLGGALGAPYNLLKSTPKINPLPHRGLKLALRPKSARTVPPKFFRLVRKAFFY